MEEGKVSVIVKWSGATYNISLLESDSVSSLKNEIFKKTQVMPMRQKLLNLKYNNKIATDDIKLSQLKLKENYKIMMIGSTEHEIESVSKPEEESNIIDDFDIADDKEIIFEENDLYLNKIEKRIKNYEIKEINPPRKDKKLLVLDVDYTLFDHRSSAETGSELARPFLHDFLTAAYEYYDIVIWSATSMKWIEGKMKLLGVSDNPNYKMTFYLDSNAMISVCSKDKDIFDVKPLGLIWGKYPDYYSAKNTIMFDDIRKNFLMNRQSGLKIKAFRNAHVNRYKDTELLKLKKYLVSIAKDCDDFTTLNHDRWEKYDL